MNRDVFSVVLVCVYVSGAWSIYCITMPIQGSETNRAITQCTTPQPTVTASASNWSASASTSSSHSHSLSHTYT